MKAFYFGLIRTGEFFQSPILFLVRLLWGWEFFLAGLGKLMDLDHTAQFFGTLGIPFPYANAVLVALIEGFGGAFLVLGFASRLVSLPLIFTMVIAYLTTEQKILMGIFDDPMKFIQAAPFSFLFAAIIIFVFGPGKISVDYLVKRFLIK